MEQPNFSIIIPAYNEEKNIKSTIESIENFFLNRNIHYEIIVVDDGSTDNTLKLIQENFKNPSVKIIKNESNSGKGASVRNGVLNASGRYILFTDADLSTPIGELEKFMKYIEKDFDIVIGSRALRDSRLIIRQPWYRERMGKIFNFFVRNLVVKNIKDTQCGFKLFKAESAKKIFKLQQIKGFGFDMEILFVARKMRLKIAEVPVEWRNRIETRVKILRDSFTMLLDILRILINNSKGLYSENGKS